MNFPLVGNARLRDAVQSVISAGRIPHAILIEGDVGLGHHTLAAFLRMAAVCGESDAPCGTCRNCHLAQVGTHPDITVISPEKDKKFITVNTIREVRQQAFVKPHMANRRVFVIDPADAMNEQAQNALLKILEEPPEGVIFLLLAPSKTAFLETIVSRCVVLTLSAPLREEALGYLRQVSKKSDPELADALDESENNIGRALAILSKKKGDAAELAAADFLRLLFEGNEYEMLKLLAPFEKNRVTAEAFFRALKTATAGQLRREYANTIRSRILCGLYDQVNGDERLLKTNINLSLLFSAAVCRVMQLKKEAEI